MLRITAALIAGMLLSAPAAAYPPNAQTKSQILACAGAPDHTERRGSVEYLYYRAQIATEALPYGSAALAARDECETIVVLKNGRTATAEHRTSPDLLRGQLCSPQVNQCLN